MKLAMFHGSKNVLSLQLSDTLLKPSHLTYRGGVIGIGYFDEKINDGIASGVIDPGHDWGIAYLGVCTPDSRFKTEWRR